MKILSFLFISTFLVTAYGNSDLISCEREGMRFGDGEGNDEISSRCEELFLAEASEKLKARSSDGSLSLYAFKNIIFVKDKNTKLKGQNVIAGTATNLEHAEAVIFDEVNREIIVLDKSGKILFFDMVMTGNVLPKRMIVHQELEKASQIMVFQDHLIAWNPSAEELVFFNRLNDVGISLEKKLTSPTLVLTHVKGKTIVLDKAANALKAELPSGEFSVVYTFPK